MKKAALVIYWVLFLTTNIFSQNRQALLTTSAKDNIVINDSRVDSAGNVVSVGMTWPYGTSYYNCNPIIIKTSKNGARVWTRTLNYSGAKALKVRIAANGDYLVLAKDNWPILCRYSPTGAKVFAGRYTYTNQLNDYITGITELSNHQIAICGFNDFTYGFGGGHILKGYFIHTDSVGNTIAAPTGYSFTLQTYGYDHSSSYTNDFKFYDVACVGNKLYFAGSYQPTIGGERGLILRTDLYGYNPAYYITAPTISYGSGSAAAVPFSTIEAVQGRLYVSALFNSSGTTQNYLIGKLDTSSFLISGIELHINNITIQHAQSFVRDTNNWYYALQPNNNFIFGGRITNGSVVQNRSIRQDSSIVLSGLAVVQDTVLYNGLIWLGSYNAGFLASYNMAAPASALCSVADSPVQSSLCSVSMSLLAGAPAASQRNLSSFSFIAAGPLTCVYDMHLCGTILCSNAGLASSITLLSPSAVCPGDAMKLVRSATCNHLKWYRDTVQLPNIDTLLIPTDATGKGSGRYFVITDNGACTDTSLAVVLKVYPAPVKPLIIQSGDTLSATSNATYQWLDSNTNIIPGAIQAIYMPLDSGRYFVRVKDSNGCIATSEAYYYVRPPKTELSVRATYLHTVSIYPNPASTAFTLTKQTGEPVSITISDNTGISFVRCQQTERSHIYRLSDMALPIGIYTVLVNGKDIVERHKLVILK